MQSDTVPIRNKIILQVGIYAVSMISMSFLWANNFGKFINFEGEDFIYCVGFCIGLTYLFNTVYYFTLGTINVSFFMLVPIIVAVLALVSGFFMMTGFEIDGTPSQITYLYTANYLVISLISVYLTFRKRI